MIQEAKTAICKALSIYKLEDGKFNSYSFKFIQGAIFGEISCSHDIFSFNSTSGKICKIIRKVRRAFYIEKGKYPTEEETVDKVWEIYLKEIAERDKIGKARGKKKKNGEEDDEAPKPPSKKTIRQLYHLTFKIDQSTRIDQRNEKSNALPIVDPDNSIEELLQDKKGENHDTIK